MKGIIRLSDKIVLLNNEFMINLDVMYDYNFDYEIIIDANLEKDYLNLILDKKALMDAIDIKRMIIRTPYDLRLLDELEKENLEDIEYVMLDIDLDKIEEYLERNPILRTKKLVLNLSNDFDIDILYKIKSIFKDEVKNLYFVLSGNQNLVGYDEYSETVLKINEIVERVNRYDFSPLEKIMYIYDIVRSKIYRDVDEIEDKLISRNLSTALTGDKIVCLGYSQIFKTILIKLGIDAKTVILYGENEGHARNEVFIKDEKYEIDGVYYFDLTWDRKKNEKDNSYLYSYKYFALTKDVINKIDNGELRDVSFPYYKENFVQEITTLIDECDVEDLPEDVIMSINHMSKLINNQKLIFYSADDIKKNKTPSFLVKLMNPSKEILVEKIKKMVKYFDNSISANVLERVLLNVRKIQYYEHEEQYPFGISDLNTIVKKSNWSYDMSLTSEQNNMCGDDDLLKKYIILLKRGIDKDRNDKQIEQVRVAKTLRKILEKRKGGNINE